MVRFILYFEISQILVPNRAQGGREAEREERQLWETPERKRSTKPVHGKLNC